jgi:hypothetical protein
MKGKTERCSGSLLFYNCKGTDFPEKAKKPGLRQVSVDKLDENHLQFFKGLCNLNADFLFRHSLSAGGPPSAPLRLRGLAWTRFSRRSLAAYVPINFVLTFR